MLALQAIVTELRIAMFAVGAPGVERLSPELLFDLDAPILSRTERSPE